jgi:predicted nucleotide-binding protein
MKDIRLNKKKSEIELYDDQSANAKAGIKSEKIFIVHGHNEEMKLTAARLIEKLGLKPIILHEQPNKGRTIIEKFERLTQDISFAIVLLSADDEKADGKYQARQNVILEWGYFIAKLGRENVVALYDESTESDSLEIPSDISGILYEPYDKPVSVKKQDPFP